MLVVGLSLEEIQSAVTSLQEVIRGYDGISDEKAAAAAKSIVLKICQQAKSKAEWEKNINSRRNLISRKIQEPKTTINGNLQQPTSSPQQHQAPPPPLPQQQIPHQQLQQNQIQPQQLQHHMANPYLIQTAPQPMWTMPMPATTNHDQALAACWAAPISLAAPWQASTTLSTMMGTMPPPPQIHHPLQLNYQQLQPNLLPMAMQQQQQQQQQQQPPLHLMHNVPLMQQQPRAPQNHQFTMFGALVRPQPTPQPTPTPRPAAPSALYMTPTQMKVVDEFRNLQTWARQHLLQQAKSIAAQAAKEKSNEKLMCVLSIIEADDLSTLNLKITEEFLNEFKTYLVSISKMLSTKRQIEENKRKAKEEKPAAPLPGSDVNHPGVDIDEKMDESMPLMEIDIEEEKKTPSEILLETLQQNKKPKAVCSVAMLRLLKEEEEDFFGLPASLCY